MKNRKMTAGLVCLFVWCSHTGASVLIDEGTSSLRKQQPKNGIVFSGQELRRQRKVGLGVGGAGLWGILGTQLELNFSGDYSLQGGVGVGDGFQSVAFQLRRYLSGSSLLPFISVGAGRWYTTGSGMKNTQKTNPDFLAKQFLNKKEKTTGQFSQVFLAPTAGVQYLQLSGDWQGSSLYAEVNLIIDMEDLVLAPYGSLGYIFYF